MKSSEPANFAKLVVQSEIAALKQVADLLSCSFNQTVELILSAPPETRLIVSGMGKAGFIAQKISATLASIGFPSFFIHPADAVHGDLGRCTANDIVIILSNSGETEEVVRLLPIIKRLGAKLIAITASSDSTLGRLADLVLKLGKIDEAGPLGLAPTSSTTAMLALGDALAMTLVQERGFTREEFATFHPGGDLGRALLRVDEIMRTGEMLCIVDQSETIRSVVHRLGVTKGRPGAAAIVDKDLSLIGIFTNGDLRRCLAEHNNALDLIVSDHATKNPKVIQSSHLAQEAAKIMTTYLIDDLLVIDAQNRPIGLIDVQDLLARGIK